MIAVIFEVWPAQGRKDDYLGIAAALRVDLNRIDGFISIERFQSLSNTEKLLSLSFWRDEVRARRCFIPRLRLCCMPAPVQRNISHRATGADFSSVPHCSSAAVDAGDN